MDTPSPPPVNSQRSRTKRIPNAVEWTTCFHCDVRSRVFTMKSDCVYSRFTVKSYYVYSKWSQTRSVNSEVKPRVFKVSLGVLTVKSKTCPHCEVGARVFTVKSDLVYPLWSQTMCIIQSDVIQRPWTENQTTCIHGENRLGVFTIKSDYVYNTQWRQTTTMNSDVRLGVLKNDASSEWRHAVWVHCKVGSHIHSQSRRLVLTMMSYYVSSVQSDYMYSCTLWSDKVRSLWSRTTCVCCEVRWDEVYSHKSRIRCIQSDIIPHVLANSEVILRVLTLNTDDVYSEDAC